MVALILFTSSLFSQPVEQWVARYDSGGTDQLYAMSVDASGNVYTTGASVQVPFTADYLTVKYNSAGIKQWEKSYNGIAGSDDRAYAIAIDAVGNVYVTGGSAYDNSIVTIKYSSLGDSLWTRTYTGPTSGHNWTFAKSIFVDDSGYVYIAGTSEGLTAVHGLRQDYTTIKYSSLGVQQWVSRYNGPGTDADVINSMTVDPTGNVYVTGFAGGGSTGSGDSYNNITTIKYNPLGDTLWTKTFIGIGISPDEGNKLTLDNLGNVYVTGTTYVDTSAEENIITIKYAADGTEQWKKFFNGPGNNTDEGIALIVDSLHNLYVTGKSVYSTTDGFDIVTIKYDSSGTQVWDRNFNGSASMHDIPAAITLDNAGNIYVLGTSANTSTSEDFQLIKYNSAGTQQWEKTYSNSNAAGSQEYAAALFVDNLNNIYVAGTSALDYAIVKYGQPTALEETKEDLAVVVLYPNPATDFLFVKTETLLIQQLNVYNTAGILLSKTQEQFIDVSFLPVGIYIAEINLIDEKAVMKTVCVKKRFVKM
ncbi:MAG: SBBP repeat-containing protein [Bacteroidetes bacterium]|nr:SBBP repeat-containing protein [Bacteroidota bacterium]